MTPNRRLNGERRRCAAAWVGVAAWLFSAGPSHAFELYNSGETKVRWDNTLRYSSMFRLENPDARLIADPNSDDGDRSFRKGLASNRFDWLSELGLSYGRFGAEASTAAWYDTVYNEHNDNDWPSSFNPASVPYDTFTRRVRNLQGRHIELVNAFVHGDVDIAGTPLRFRIGRHSLVWGESLFFADNGIAAGQSPTDAIKALGLSYAHANDVVMPVAQASFSWQPRANVTLDFYYQFEWRRGRVPGVGSYFSAADMADAGGERIILGPNQYFARGADQTPPDSGQYGIGLHINTDEIDYGFYALRFNAKYPQLYLRRTATTLPAATTVERQQSYGLPSGVGGDSAFKINLPPNVYHGAGVFGSYDLVYPRGIQIFGMSMSGYIGDSNVAGEISGRRRMPLVSRPSLVLPGVLADGDANAHYAVGDTLHAQISSISVLAPNRLWDGASLSVEVAANHLLDVTRNPLARDTTRDHTAVAIRANFEPQYFRVVPDVDITVPLGIGYGLTGNSSTDGSMSARSGDVEFGLRAVYRTVWEASATFTHFIGSPARQPFADRDFISFSVRRTF